MKKKNESDAMRSAVSRFLTLQSRFSSYTLSLISNHMQHPQIIVLPKSLSNNIKNRK